jgi:DNA-binding protein HU-beta
MNQSEMIQAVAERTKMSQAEVKRIFDTFKEVAYDHFEQNKTSSEMPLPGFGKFKVTERTARTGRNPKTGEEISIPKRNVPVFRPSTELKNHIQPAE